MRYAVFFFVLALLAVPAAWAEDPVPEIPEYQGPDITLTLDKLAGSYTFWRHLEAGYENGFIDLGIDHSFKLVTELDRDRDRVSDEHHVAVGEYGITRLEDGSVTVWLQETGADERFYAGDLIVVAGKAKRFHAMERSFIRREEGMPYFVIKHNQPATAKELIIESEPAGAVVFLDGLQLEGVTPLSVKSPPAETTLTIKVVQSEFQPVERKVKLAQDETRRISIRLVQGEAGLEVESTPWVKVKLDGHFLGVTPLRREDLPAGDHEIELYNQSLELSVKENVTLVKGEFVKKRYDFTGRLVVDVGRKCTIYRLGKKAGVTPFDGQVPVGRHVLELEDEAGRRKRVVVKVLLGESTRLEKPFDSLPKAF
jgi:PEGA domain